MNAGARARPAADRAERQGEGHRRRQAMLLHLGDLQSQRRAGVRRLRRLPGLHARARRARHAARALLALVHPDLQRNRPRGRYFSALGCPADEGHAARLQHFPAGPARAPARRAPQDDRHRRRARCRGRREARIAPFERHPRIERPPARSESQRSSASVHRAGDQPGALRRHALFRGHAAGGRLPRGQHGADQFATRRPSRRSPKRRAPRRWIRMSTTSTTS